MTVKISIYLTEYLAYHINKVSSQVEGNSWEVYTVSEELWEKYQAAKKAFNEVELELLKATYWGATA